MRPLPINPAKCCVVRPKVDLLMSPYSSFFSLPVGSLILGACSQAQAATLGGNGAFLGGYQSDGSQVLPPFQSGTSALGTKQVTAWLYRRM